MIRQDENDQNQTCAEETKYDDTKQQNNLRHDRRIKTRTQKLEGSPTGIRQEKDTQGKTTQGKTDA